MNTKQILAAVTFAAIAGSSFAAGATTDATGNFFDFNTSSAATPRAAVIADLAQNRVVRGEFQDFTPANSGVTRIEIASAVSAARANGSLASHEFFEPADYASANGRSRAEVKAEVAQYLSGQRAQRTAQ